MSTRGVVAVVMVWFSLFKNGFIREANSSCFWRTEQRAKGRGEGRQGRPARRAPVCTIELRARKMGRQPQRSRGQILDGPGASPPTLRRTQRREASGSGRRPQHQRAARGASPFLVREPQRSGAWSHATAGAGVPLRKNELDETTAKTES